MRGPHSLLCGLNLGVVQLTQIEFGGQNSGSVFFIISLLIDNWMVGMFMSSA